MTSTPVGQHVLNDFATTVTPTRDGVPNNQNMTPFWRDANLATPSHALKMQPKIASAAPTR